MSKLVCICARSCYGLTHLTRSEATHMQHVRKTLPLRYKQTAPIYSAFFFPFFFTSETHLLGAQSTCLHISARGERGGEDVDILHKITEGDERHSTET